MATIVKLGEPKPPSKKTDEKPAAAGAGQVEIDSGLLVKIGAGVSVLAVVTLVYFFLFRGPGEDSSLTGVGLHAGPELASPVPGAGAAPVSGGAPAAMPGAVGPGAPRVAPPAGPAAATSPGAGMPPGMVLAPGSRGMPGVTTMHGNPALPSGPGGAGSASGKTGQPGPNEDPYSRENR